MIYGNLCLSLKFYSIWAKIACGSSPVGSKIPNYLGGWNGWFDKILVKSSNSQIFAFSLIKFLTVDLKTQLNAPSFFSSWYIEFKKHIEPVITPQVSIINISPKFTTSCYSSKLVVVRDYKNILSLFQVHKFKGWAIN